MDRLMIRYPAEWENQKRIWLSWPHNESNWGQRPAIREFYIELIRIIRRFQKVALLVPHELILSLPKELNNESTYGLDIFAISTNDIWIRDYGPIFVERCKKEHIVSFEFNAWGKKFPPWDTDNQVPYKIADTLGISVSTYPVVFEGGAIELNGTGFGITTKDCLIGPMRNKESLLLNVVQQLKDALGITDLLILEKGLEGDHTDGHIDNFARFLSTDHLVIAKEDNPKSPNYEILQKAHDQIAAWRPGNRPLKISFLPLPEQRVMDSEVLPASYLNFIFVNNGVVIPTYKSPYDEEALNFFRQVFPSREIVGIDCSLIIEEGGSLHCMSKQEPLIMQSENNASGYV